jgi:hypothetical protein
MSRPTRRSRNINIENPTNSNIKVLGSGVDELVMSVGEMTMSKEVSVCENV